MAEFGERPDAVVFAEGCTPGLEEGLRSNHQDFHAARSLNCRERFGKGQRNSRSLRGLVINFRSLSHVTTQEQTLSGSRARSLVITALKATVSIALLWLLFSRVDVARLWSVARNASTAWLLSALALYCVMIFASAWRWGLLLRAQHLIFPFRTLVSSFLVATFFNNFLPSNIGGDVIRIADTAPAARSKTLAATIVAVDRLLGLLALVLIAALGATITREVLHQAATPLSPWLLWIGFTLG